MIYVHSMLRAVQYYGDQPALSLGNRRSTFRELHGQVRSLVGTLCAAGFKSGDRLALLLPNGPAYIQLVYACSWLGVIVVPINTRLSTIEIDHVLSDAAPHGLVRHSSLPVPGVRVPWEVVFDQEQPQSRGESCPHPCYDPEAVLALIYTSGTTGHPKGVVLTHANVLEDLDHVNYWMTYKEGGVYLHAAPMFHIADLPFLFGAPAFGACQITIPKFSAQDFCETVERERVSHTVLVPTMISLMTQVPNLEQYDLTSLEVIGYGGSPIAPQLIGRARQALPHVKLIQVYGLSETGFLTGLQDHQHTETRLNSCGRPCLGIDVRVVDESGKEVATGHPGELVTRGGNVMRGYWNSTDETVR